MESAPLRYGEEFNEYVGYINSPQRQGMISCLVGVGHVYQILNEKWNYAFLLYMRNGFNAKISLVERLVKSMYNNFTS
jgi:hypothetical protein